MTELKFEGEPKTYVGKFGAWPAPHPMEGYVWLAKLPRGDGRRETTLGLLPGAQYQDSRERGIWRDITTAPFASQSFNELDADTLGRYGIRAPG